MEQESNLEHGEKLKKVLMDEFALGLADVPWQLFQLSGSEHVDRSTNSIRASPSQATIRLDLLKRAPKSVVLPEWFHLLEESWMPPQGAQDLHYRVALFSVSESRNFNILICAHQDDQVGLAEDRLREWMSVMPSPKSAVVDRFSKFEQSTVVLEGVFEHRYEGDLVTTQFQWIGRFGFAVFSVDAKLWKTSKAKDSSISLLLNGIPIVKLQFSIPWTWMRMVEGGEVLTIEHIVQPYKEVQVSYVKGDRGLVEKRLGSVRRYLPGIRFYDSAVNSKTKFIWNLPKCGTLVYCFSWSSRSARSAVLRREIEGAVTVLGGESVFPVVLEESAPNISSVV